MKAWLIHSYGGPEVLAVGDMPEPTLDPPDLELTRTWPMPLYVKLAIRALSWRVRQRAKQHHCRYRFMLMQPSGAQLADLARLVDAGVIRPVIDKVVPFERIPEAMAYSESGRASGKIIIRMDAPEA